LVDVNKRTSFLTTWLLAAPVGGFSDLGWRTMYELASIHVLFWTFLGVATAYRLASRPFIY
jgi:hypothetical protein